MTVRKRGWLIPTVLVLILAAVVIIGYTMVENQVTITENQQIVIANQNKSLEHQRAKEAACESDGGEVSWNTRGNQVCDLAPFARTSDTKFDFDVDWIIR